MFGHAFPAAALHTHSFWWPRAHLCLEHLSGSGVAGFQGCVRSLFLDTAQGSPGVGPPVHAALSTNGSVVSPSSQHLPLSLPFWSFWLISILVCPYGLHMHLPGDFSCSHGRMELPFDRDLVKFSAYFPIRGLISGSYVYIRFLCQVFVLYANHSVACFLTLLIVFSDKWKVLILLYSYL